MVGKSRHTHLSIFTSPLLVKMGLSCTREERMVKALLQKNRYTTTMSVKAKMGQQFSPRQSYLNHLIQSDTLFLFHRSCLLRQTWYSSVRLHCEILTRRRATRHSISLGVAPCRIGSRVGRLGAGRGSGPRGGARMLVHRDVA